MLLDERHHLTICDHKVLLNLNAIVIKFSVFCTLHKRSIQYCGKTLAIVFLLPKSRIAASVGTIPRRQVT